MEYLSALMDLVLAMLMVMQLGTSMGTEMDMPRKRSRLFVHARIRVALLDAFFCCS